MGEGARLEHVSKLHQPILEFPGVFLWVKKVVKSVDGRDQTLLLKFTHQRLLSASFQNAAAFPVSALRPAPVILLSHPKL